MLSPFQIIQVDFPGIEKNRVDIVPGFLRELLFLFTFPEDLRSVNAGKPNEEDVPEYGWEARDRDEASVGVITPMIRDVMEMYSRLGRREWGDRDPKEKECKSHSLHVCLHEENVQKFRGSLSQSHPLRNRHGAWLGPASRDGPPMVWPGGS